MKTEKLKKKAVLLGLSIVLILAVFAVASLVGKNKYLGGSESANSTSKQEGAVESTSDSQSPALDSDLVKNLPKEVSAITLGPVTGQSGSATAVVVADGNQLALAIEANLPDVGDKFYFAWLSRDVENKNLEALGKLEKKEGKYVLPASVNGPISNYQKFVITLETKDDNSAETVVLEGKVAT